MKRISFADVHSVIHDNAYIGYRRTYETFNVSLDALWLGMYVYTLALNDLEESVVSDSVI